MEPYGNRNGDSAVIAYEIGPDFIRVQFSGTPPYLYTYETVGRDNVEELKKRARAGRGLGTYISQHREVRQGYVRE